MGVTTVIKDYGSDILDAVRENDLHLLRTILEKQLRSNRQIAQLCITDIKHRPTKKFACPLILAARQEDPRIIKYMLDKGTDPNFVHHTLFTSKRREVITALHVAVDLGHYDAVEVLMNANADPNIADHKQETPLLIAVKKADRVMVRMLLAKGADPSIPDRTGDAAIHIATLYGHLQIVKTLLKSQADAYQKGRFGLIPSHIAAREGHIHLVQVFCARDIGNTNIKIPCYQDQREKAPIHLSTEQGHVETVVSLIDQFDADVNLKDSDGNTPLHCVVLNPYDPYRMRDKDYFYATAKVLVKYRVSINEKNDFGDTALHLAAMNHFQKIVEMLLSIGANPFAENDSGLKPIDIVPDNDPVTRQMLKSAMQKPRPPIHASQLSLQRDLDISFNMGNMGQMPTIREGADQSGYPNATHSTISRGHPTDRTFRSTSSMSSVFVDEVRAQKEAEKREQKQLKAAKEKAEKELAESARDLAQRERDLALREAHIRERENSLDSDQSRSREALRPGRQRTKGSDVDRRKDNQIPTYTQVKKKSTNQRRRDKSPTESLSTIQSSNADWDESVSTMDVETEGSTSTYTKYMGKMDTMLANGREPTSVDQVEMRKKGNRAPQKVNKNKAKMNAKPQPKSGTTAAKPGRHRHQPDEEEESSSESEEDSDEEETSEESEEEDDEVTVPPPMPMEDHIYVNLPRPKTKQETKQDFEGAVAHGSNVGSKRPKEDKKKRGGSAMKAGPAGDDGIQVHSIPGKPGMIEVQYTGGPITIAVDTQQEEQPPPLPKRQRKEETGPEHPYMNEADFLRAVQEQKEKRLKELVELQKKGTADQAEQPRYQHRAESPKNLDYSQNEVSGIFNGTTMIVDNSEIEQSAVSVGTQSEEVRNTIRDGIVQATQDIPQYDRGTQADNSRQREMSTSIPTQTSDEEIVPYDITKQQYRPDNDVTTVTAPAPASRQAKVVHVSRPDRNQAQNIEPDDDASPDYSPKYRTFQEKLAMFEGEHGGKGVTHMSTPEPPKPKKRKSLTTPREELSLAPQPIDVDLNAPADSYTHEPELSPSESESEESEVSPSDEYLTDTDQESVIVKPQPKPVLVREIKTEIPQEVVTLEPSDKRKSEPIVTEELPPSEMPELDVYEDEPGARHPRQESPPVETLTESEESDEETESEDSDEDEFVELEPELSDPKVKASGRVEFVKVEPIQQNEAPQTGEVGVDHREEYMEAPEPVFLQSKDRPPKLAETKLVAYGEEPKQGVEEPQIEASSSSDEESTSHDEEEDDVKKLSHIASSEDDLDDEGSFDESTELLEYEEGTISGEGGLDEISETSSDKGKKSRRPPRPQLRPGTPEKLETQPTTTIQQQLLMRQQKEKEKLAEQRMLFEQQLLAERQRQAKQKHGKLSESPRLDHLKEEDEEQDKPEDQVAQPGVKKQKRKKKKKAVVTQEDKDMLPGVDDVQKEMAEDDESLMQQRHPMETEEELEAKERWLRETLANKIDNTEPEVPAVDEKPHKTKGGKQKEKKKKKKKKQEPEPDYDDELGGVVPLPGRGSFQLEPETEPDKLLGAPGSPQSTLELEGFIPAPGQDNVSVNSQEEKSSLDQDVHFEDDDQEVVLRKKKPKKGKGPPGAVLLITPEQHRQVPIDDCVIPTDDIGSRVSGGPPPPLPGSAPPSGFTKRPVSLEQMLELEKQNRGSQDSLPPPPPELGAVEEQMEADEGLDDALPPPPEENEDTLLADDTGNLTGTVTGVVPSSDKRSKKKKKPKEMKPEELKGRKSKKAKDKVEIVHGDDALLETDVIAEDDTLSPIVSPSATQPRERGASITSESESEAADKKGIQYTVLGAPAGSKLERHDTVKRADGVKLVPKKDSENVPEKETDIDADIMGDDQQMSTPSSQEGARPQDEPARGFNQSLEEPLPKGVAFTPKDVKKDDHSLQNAKDTTPETEQQKDGQAAPQHFIRQMSGRRTHPRMKSRSSSTSSRPTAPPPDPPIDLPASSTSFEDAAFAAVTSGLQQQKRKNGQPSPGQVDVSARPQNVQRPRENQNGGLIDDSQIMSDKWKGRQDQEAEMQRLLASMSDTSSLQQEPEDFKAPEQSHAPGKQKPLPAAKPPHLQSNGVQTTVPNVYRPQPPPITSKSSRKPPYAYPGQKKDPEVVSELWSQQRGKAEVVDMAQDDHKPESSPQKSSEEPAFQRRPAVPRGRKKRPAEQGRYGGAQSDSEAFYRRGPRGKSVGSAEVHSEAEAGDYEPPKREPGTTLEQAALSTIEAGLKNQPKPKPKSTVDRSVNYTRGVYRPRPVKWLAPDKSAESGRYDDSQLVSQVWMDRNKLNKAESEGEADVEDVESSVVETPGTIAGVPRKQTESVSSKPPVDYRSPPVQMRSEGGRRGRGKRKRRKDKPLDIKEAGPVDFNKFGMTAQLWMEQVDKNLVEKSKTMYMSLLTDEKEIPEELKETIRRDSGTDDVFLPAQWVIARGRSIRHRKRRIDRKSRMDSMSEGATTSGAESDLDSQGRPMSYGRQLVLFFKVGGNWQDLAWVLFDGVHTEGETLRMIKDIQLKHKRKLTAQVQDLMHRWWRKKGSAATIEELERALKVVHMMYIQEEIPGSHHASFAYTDTEDDDELNVSNISDNDPEVSRLINEYNVRSLNASFDVLQGENPELASDALIEKLEQQAKLKSSSFGSLPAATSSRIDRSRLGTSRESFGRKSSSGSRLNQSGDNVSLDYDSDLDQSKSFVIVQPQLKSTDFRHETTL